LSSSSAAVIEEEEKVTSTAEPYACNEDATIIRATPGSRIYFAYGSNVNTKTMTGVRGINPSAAYPTVLPNYKLSFNVPGLPYVEPGFASVKRVDGVSGSTDRDTDTDTAAADADDDDLSKYGREVHGVAYVVTDEEWRYILRTETSYLEEEVILARCSDGAAVAATTLVGGVVSSVMTPTLTPTPRGVPRQIGYTDHPYTAVASIECVFKDQRANP
jgi:hypothetical protein